MSTNSVRESHDKVTLFGWVLAGFWPILNAEEERAVWEIHGDPRTINVEHCTANSDTSYVIVTREWYHHEGCARITENELNTESERTCSA